MTSLKVSLPPHLKESLEPLIGSLPPDLNKLVEQSLGSTEIAYDTLVDVSNWALAEENQLLIKDKGLNPQDYTRLALLAGTVTAPSRRMPPPEPKPEPWEIAQEEKNTRRAIAALVNGVFSMVGVGAAVWWASKTTGWSHEIKIGLAIFGGLFTGLAEAGLFIIYYNRREKAREYREKQREKRKARLTKQYLKETQTGEAGDITLDVVEKQAEDEASSSEAGESFALLDNEGLTKEEAEALKDLVPVDFAGLKSEEDDNGLRRRVIAEIIDEDGD